MGIENLYFEITSIRQFQIYYYYLIKTVNIVASNISKN